MPLGEVAAGGERRLQCRVVNPMLDELRRVTEDEPGIAYALLFGSGGRGALRATSDIDVAVELRPGTPRDAGTLGRLAARLESAVDRRVDLVLMDEAASPLAYRIFRDGRIIVNRDHPALVARKARAILEYLDFKPVEERCADGVLRAAAGRG
jgi:predicted nucleotidyltransferase